MACGLHLEEWCAAAAVSEVANNALDQTKSASAIGTAAFAGQRARWADMKEPER